MNSLGLGMAAGAVVVSVAALIQAPSSSSNAPQLAPIDQRASAHPAPDPNDSLESLKKSLEELRQDNARLRATLERDRSSDTREPCPPRIVHSDTLPWVRLRIDAVVGKPLVEVIAEVGRVAGLRVEQLSPINASAIFTYTESPGDHGEVCATEVFHRVGGVPLSYRVGPGVLKVASPEFFEALDRQTIAYDCSRLIDSQGRQISVHELAEVITKLISRHIQAGNDNLNVEAVDVLSPSMIFVTGDEVTQARTRWVFRRITASGSFSGESIAPGSTGQSQ